MPDTKYTPGAMKAASAMVDLYETTVFSPGSRARLAEIITRETGDKEMGHELQKIVEWLDRLADKSEESAKDKRFLSLAQAHAADAKNYRATAKPAKEILRKAGLL